MSALRSVGATKGLAQEFLYWMDGWINVFSLAALKARRLSQCGQSVTAGFCKFEDCSLFRKWFVKVGPTYIP